MSASLENYVRDSDKFRFFQSLSREPVLAKWLSPKSVDESWIESTSSKETETVNPEQ